MEWGLLELLFQGSCCLLEIMAASADVGAGIAGARARRKFKSQRVLQESGENAPAPVGAIILFFLLFALGAFLTIWVVIKWTHF